jgi:N-carbamoylputrescine amidase
MIDRRVTIGLVQHACSEDSSENVERALAGVKEAAAQGAELVCLPELFSRPYFPQVEDARFFDWAEPAEGETARAVSAVCKELGVTVLAGFFERRAAGVYHNSLLVIGSTGETLALYRKMHIPDDPQFLEKFYFAPGDLGFMSVSTSRCEVGPLICWDQWYPEAARLTAMHGAEALFYPTAIGWLPQEKAEHGAAQLSSWQTVMRAHAITNGVFTVAVNRVGIETSTAGSIEFWGHSFICSPTGEILVEAGTEPAVLVAECDLAKVTVSRQTWPFFRDRRIDAYGDLTKRWAK